MDASARRIVPGIAFAVANGLVVAACQALFPIEERVADAVDAAADADGGPNTTPDSGDMDALVTVACGPSLTCRSDDPKQTCCIGGPPYTYACGPRPCASSTNAMVCDKKAQCADPRICCFASGTGAPTGSKCAYPDGGGSTGLCGPEICDPLDAPPCSNAGFACVDSGPDTPPGKDTPPGYHVCVPSG